MQEPKGYLPGTVFLVSLQKLLEALAELPVFLIASKNAYSASESFFKKYIAPTMYEIYFISQEPSEQDRAACAEKISAFPAEGIIFAFGGGSCLDLAKVVGKDGNRRVIAVPTTPSSGAEASPIVLLTNRDGKKIYLSDKAFLPSMVVLDPTLLQSIPREKLGAMCMDIIAHAVESLYSRFSNPLAHAYARMALEKLEETVHLNAEPNYASMQLAGFFGGIAQGIAGTGLCHALAHNIGAPRGLAHADAVALFLRSSIEVSAEHAEVSVCLIANDFPYERIFSLIKNLTQLYPLERQMIKLPTTHEVLSLIHRDPCFLSHPFRPNEEELTRILDAV